MKPKHRRILRSGWARVGLLVMGAQLLTGCEHFGPGFGVSELSSPNDSMEIGAYPLPLWPRQH